MATTTWVRSLDGTHHGPSVAYPVVLVHREFELRAVETPQKTAVRYRDDSLSYSELNRAANRLANFLRAKGVSKEGRVAVCLDPSFDIAISLLAILKVGATYVPLNPGHPIKRLQTLIEDVNPVAAILFSLI